MTASDITGASNNWLVEDAIRRRAQWTCSPIKVTEDKKRIDQLIDSAATGGQALLLGQVKGYRKILEWNLQRNELKEISKPGREIIRVPVADQDQPVIQLIDKELHNTSPLGSDGLPTQPQSALVIIHNVMTKPQADAIANWLVAWSKDNSLFVNQGTVYTFTTDESLFIEPVRRACNVQYIPTGSVEEIRAQIQNLVDKINKNNREMRLRVDEQEVQAAKGLDLTQTVTSYLYGLSISKTTPKRCGVEPFTEMKIQQLKTIGLNLKTPEIGPDDLGGYQSLKAEINFIASLVQDPAKTAHYGLSLPRGFLLDGPPGTGKTRIAEVLAWILKMPFVKLENNNLYKGIVGESEATVNKIFRALEALSPLVLFIDEADAVFPRRDKQVSTDSGVGRRVFNDMLDKLASPKRGYLVMMATNLVEDIDEAAIRPGRIGACYYVPYPDMAARQQIFQVQCTRLHHYLMDPQIDYSYLAKQSCMMSGAEIEKWCELASQQALRQNSEPVTQGHFEDVEEQVTVNIDERIADMRKKIEVRKHIMNFNVPQMDRDIQGLMAEITGRQGSSIDTFTQNLGK